MRLDPTVILRFLAPYVAVLSGAIADWLFVHIHFLGDFHDKSQVVQGITQFIVWGLTAVLVWLGQSHLFTVTKGDSSE